MVLSPTQYAVWQFFFKPWTAVIPVAIEYTSGIFGRGSCASSHAKVLSTSFLSRLARALQWVALSRGNNGLWTVLIVLKFELQLACDVTSSLGHYQWYHVHKLRHAHKNLLDHHIRPNSRPESFREVNGETLFFYSGNFIRICRASWISHLDENRNCLIEA